jgi:ABC-type glycerol-3-phosphate transport system substrate-binding protein
MKGTFLSRSLVAILALLLVFGLFAGCTTNTTTTEGQTTQATTKADKPVNIRWARGGVSQDPTKDRVLLELQKQTSTAIEFVTTPDDQYQEKLNVMMASGEQLDVVNCDPNANTLGWAKDGLLIAYDDLIKDNKYPYVSSILNADLFADMKIDGKFYFKPLPLCPQVQGNVIRQDWLDKLNLKMPTTIDELYTVIKAFTEQDPDGNGKNDTIGLFAGGDYFDFVMSIVTDAYAIGGGSNPNNNWLKLPDGTLTRWEVSDNYKQALIFCRKLISEGLINKDWASVKIGDGSYLDEFAKGKVGIMIISQPQIILQKLHAINPDAKMAFLPPLKGENGVPANGGHTGGYWNGNVIPKTCANPDKVMQLMEYCMTKDGRELMNFGVRDIHIKEVKEETGRRLYVLNKEECDKDWDTKTNGYTYPLSWGTLSYYENSYIPMEKYGYDYDEAITHVESWILEEMAGDPQFANWAVVNAEYAIANPMINMLDDRIIMDSKLASMYVENELKCLVATEADFEATYNDGKEKWLNAGGQTLIDNGNEVYKGLAGK